jgi:hypothetical protein
MRFTVESNHPSKNLYTYRYIYLHMYTFRDTLRVLALRGQRIDIFCTLLFIPYFYETDLCLE